jgi:hypothetical protein
MFLQAPLEDVLGALDELERQVAGGSRMKNISAHTMNLIKKRPIPTGPPVPSR